jgi:Ran GTPase-activating protein (RanGAP) involved in mRNA processing and transport
LSLPDNLLSFKEAQLIASMITKNTPLKILNLQRNSFDHQSAVVIGDALLSNNNLKSLDMSYNRIGDVGVRNLLYPLLMMGLKDVGAIADVPGSNNSLLARSSTM